MVVYVEYVLIDNIIIDYMLLKAIFLILGRQIKKIRLIVSASFGGVFALILPMIENFPFVEIPYKLATGLFMVIIADKRFTFRSFYLSALTFFGLTFLTGGAITGIYNLLGLDYNSELSIATVFIPAYLMIKLAIKLIKYFYRKKTDMNFTYKVSLSVGKTTLTAQGFLDTGNTLYEGVNPVILCGKSFAKKLIGDDMIRVNPRKINLTTASGSSQNFAFTADEFLIYNGTQLNIYNNVTVCVASDNLFDGYEIILHPKLLKEKEDASAFDVEKVS